MEKTAALRGAVFLLVISLWLLVTGIAGYGMFIVGKAMIVSGIGKFMAGMGMCAVLGFLYMASASQMHIGRLGHVQAS